MPQRSQDLFTLVKEPGNEAKAAHGREHFSDSSAITYLDQVQVEYGVVGLHNPLG